MISIKLKEILNLLGLLMNNVKICLNEWNMLYNQVYDKMVNINDNHDKQLFQFLKLLGILRQDITTNINDELEILSTKMKDSKFPPIKIDSNTKLIVPSIKEPYKFQDLTLSSAKLLWDISMTPEGVQTILSTTNDSRTSFMCHISNFLTNIQSKNEILSTHYLGILTNISAVPDGLAYILNNENCDHITNRMISLLNILDNSNYYEEVYQNMILKYLFNFSLHGQGYSILSKQKHIIDLLIRLMQNNNTKDIIRGSIRLVKVLINEQHVSYKIKIESMIDKSFVESIIDSKDGQLIQDILSLKKNLKTSKRCSFNY
ncbi:hypothetical protein A3Q56_00661 [Intoshia linei]|uniref:Uncharacterized protein n=1 Tax=Intoshia linei TaxID=1819745 RepID=A0A177BCY8_9BILA|nr:hypothetical protein A3Q56_00661 [Intoshia linei]